MNAKDIILTRAELLRETINITNDSPFSTDDLAKIIEADQTSIWSEPLTGEQLMEEINQWKNNG
jgi:hypothetical protein